MSNAQALLRVLLLLSLMIAFDLAEVVLAEEVIETRRPTLKFSGQEKRSCCWFAGMPGWAWCYGCGFESLQAIGEASGNYRMAVSVRPARHSDRGVIRVVFKSRNLIIAHAVSYT